MAVISLLKRRKRKSSEVWWFQSFALICYLLSRCVRDSNPWPHAWQACILTNWTNAPFLVFFGISPDCGCKGRHFFEICNIVLDFFVVFFVVAVLYCSYIVFCVEKIFWEIIIICFKLLWDILVGTITLPVLANMSQTNTSYAWSHGKTVSTSYQNRFCSVVSPYS